MSDPLLQVEGLRTVFPRGGGEHAVVDGVTFSLSRGETLGLAGESGSGKTMTALSLVRLVAPPGRVAGGRVVLNGRDIAAAPERDLWHVRGREIGFVFQEPAAALNPVYTIGRQLEETLSVHGLARGKAAAERAVALLDAVHVPDPRRRAAQYAHQLSGGLRQRAMIALAIAAEPVLLIADEPTTALDATVQAEILDLLREMRASLGLAMLLITHDFGVIAETADRVAVMRHGRIVEEGDVRQVLGAPVHEYTRHLLACAAGERTAQ
jgi:peptide/nickel transport system ATP-binding protein